MGNKLTAAEKAEAAKKRAALKAETDAKKAEEKAKSDAQAKAKAGADAKAAAKPKAKQVSVKTVRGVNSRWRAGYGFGPDPREIPLDDLSEDQLQALEADPSLVVSLEG